MESPPKAYPLQASSIPESARKKEFCTFWIRNGKCGYAHRGCKYKHIMPDLPKLQEMGLCQVPDWYLQQEAKAEQLAQPHEKPGQVSTMDKSEDAPASRQATSSSPTVRTTNSGMYQSSYDTGAPLRRKVIFKPSAAKQKHLFSPRLYSYDTIHGAESLIDLDLHEADVVASK